jgi:hypothetical protein
MVTLFDTHPKSNPKYLYGREKELNDLVGHVKNGDWVVLLGPRRVGKTSLARCTATKLGIRTLVIDARIESDFARGLTNGLSGPPDGQHTRKRCNTSRSPFSERRIHEGAPWAATRATPVEREERASRHCRRGAVAEESPRCCQADGAHIRLPP